MLIKTLVLVSALLACALFAYWLGGESALEGAAVGGGLGVLLCAASHLLLSLARRASGRAVLAAMLASAFGSLGLTFLGMLVIASLWREVLLPAALTAVAVYLAYRFVEAFQAAGACAGRPCKGGGQGKAPLPRGISR